MTRSQAIERVMVAAVCVFSVLCCVSSVLFFAAFVSCLSALRSCLNPMIEIRLPPKTFTWPFEVLWWLVQLVAKAMFGISLE